MRTTLAIDDDLLEAAKALALQRRVSLGKVVSELMRRGLNPVVEPGRGKGGFPTFEIPPDSRPITLDIVKQAEDEP